MAGDYWDVGQWKETGSGKNFFVRLGSAKQRDGGGFYVDFDALPMPRPDQKGNLRCSVVIQPPKGSTGGGRQGGGSDNAPF
jgi:hypothetical protein